MGFWNRKGKHDRAADSSSGRRRGSVKKEEPASPPRSSRRAPAPAPFTISPRAVGERDRRYLAVDVRWRY